MALWPTLGSAILTRGGNRFALAPAQTYVLGPGAGAYMVQLDALGYIALQYRDAVTGCWFGMPWPSAASVQLVYSDGVSVRIANITGCPQAIASLTIGSGYTSSPTVTPSAGNSIWQAIVGGSVNSAFTITNGGTNYTYPPLVIFEPPPTPGVQATGFCTLTNGAVSGITLSIPGAGYVQPPILTFLNDPRELSPISPAITTGYGASAIATLIGAGAVTALAMLDQGSSVGSTPTLVFSGGGGSGAAAVISTIIAAAPATAYIQQM